MRRSPVVRRGGRIRRIGPRDGSVPAPCAGGTRRSAGRCVPPPEAPPPRRRRSGGRPARAGRGGAAGARATSAAWVRRDAPPPPPLGPPTARGSGTPSSERTPARSHLEPRSSCVFQGAPPRLQGRPCTVGPNPSPGGGTTEGGADETDTDRHADSSLAVTRARTCGRGTSSFVDNGRVEMFQLTDILADDEGNRIRARVVFLDDLSRDEVRIDTFELTCIGS